MFFLFVIVLTLQLWMQMGWYVLLVQTNWFEGLDEAVEQQTAYQHFRTFLSILQSLVLWPAILLAFQDQEDEDDDDDDSAWQN